MMTRRNILAGASAFTCTVLAHSNISAQSKLTDRHPLWPHWELWRAAHLEFDGRVVDKNQASSSHSESQGYGAFLAAQIGDLDAFRRIVEWTETNLAIRDDTLLAWRWLPDETPNVPDLNNASDGDLFFAWALVIAAEKFNQPQYLTRARSIAADLVETCVIQRPDRPGSLILLPAMNGFVQNGIVTINPSYMMPRALREVGRATSQPALINVASSALELMAEISIRQLVPDWIDLDQTGVLFGSEGSANMGYEALRIPLFLAWSGETGQPALRRAAGAYDALGMPFFQSATILDATSGKILESNSEPGYAAISALTQCAILGGAGSAIPDFTAQQSYYAATLHLFTLLAQQEFYPSCMPL